MLTEVWLKAGKDARDIFLIQQLEQTLLRVASQVQKLDIDEVVLVDGGDGNAIANHVASMPRTVAAVFEALRSTTGVDVTGILQGQSTEVK